MVRKANLTPNIPCSISETSWDDHHAVTPYSCASSATYQKICTGQKRQRQQITNNTQQEQQQRQRQRQHQHQHEDSGNNNSNNKRKRFRKSMAQPRPRIQVPARGIGPIHEPNRNDVLSGRGGRINSHHGNIQFRDLVHRRKYEYLKPNTKKLEKAHIAADIVNTIRNMEPNGRFLKQDMDGLWFDIGDTKAIKKVGQALREDASNVRRQEEEICFSNIPTMARSLPTAPARQNQPETTTTMSTLQLQQNFNSPVSVLGPSVMLPYSIEKNIKTSDSAVVASAEVSLPEQVHSYHHRRSDSDQAFGRNFYFYDPF